MPNNRHVRPDCYFMISCFADVGADKLDFPVSKKRNPCTVVS